MGTALVVTSGKGGVGKNHHFGKYRYRIGFTRQAGRLVGP